MAFDKIYNNQVELLLDVLPVLNQFECFALKGGTAINLFIRDMPRLSVDIDLAYLPIEPREIFLNNIGIEMLKMKESIEKNSLEVKEVYAKDGQLLKLNVHKDDAIIKIEPNLVIRGSVFSIESHELCKRAQNQFLRYSQVKTLSFADLYGGKICAALDRQHPRDLFDIKCLLEEQGISDEVRQAFIVYLCSSNRPIHELLNPKPKLVGFEDDFNNNFRGMTDITVSSSELVSARQELINIILSDLTENERHFILSLKSGNPDWSLMPIPGLKAFPSLQWKIINIQKMNTAKRDTMLKKLEAVLGQSKG